MKNSKGKVLVSFLIFSSLFFGAWCLSQQMKPEFDYEVNVEVNQLMQTNNKQKALPYSTEFKPREYIRIEARKRVP